MQILFGMLPFFACNRISKEKGFHFDEEKKPIETEVLVFFWDLEEKKKKGRQLTSKF